MFSQFLGFGLDAYDMAMVVVMAPILTKLFISPGGSLAGCGKTADFVKSSPNLLSSDGERGLFVSLLLAYKHLVCPADTLRP
jgi:hypothetical protein